VWNTLKYSANTIHIEVIWNSIGKHLYNPAHSPWLGQALFVTRLRKVLKETRGCLAMAASTFPLWRQLTHLPISTYRPGTTNNYIQLFDLRGKEKKRHLLRPHRKHVSDWSRTWPWHGKGEGNSESWMDGWSKSLMICAPEPTNMRTSANALGKIHATH